MVLKPQISFSPFLTTNLAGLQLREHLIMQNEYQKKHSLSFKISNLFHFNKRGIAVGLCFTISSFGILGDELQSLLHL